MGYLISPQHQGSVLCLEDGFSFYKLTQRPPAHRTGRLVFVHFLFFYLVFLFVCFKLGLLLKLQDFYNIQFAPVASLTQFWIYGWLKHFLDDKQRAL